MRAKGREPLPWCHLSSRPALPALGPWLAVSGKPAPLYRVPGQFGRRASAAGSRATFGGHGCGGFQPRPAVSTSAGPPTLLDQSRYAIARDYTMLAWPLPW